MQPYLPAVDKSGETMLVFFGGRYSHAFMKGPMLSVGHVGGDEVYLPEQLGPAEPGPEARQLAADCLAVAADDAGVASTTSPTPASTSSRPVTAPACSRPS